jgi:3-hydroxybutyrate dehydrogenase
MADMTEEEALEKYGPSEVTRDDILEIPDDAYTTDNVAIVTGAGNGIGYATALVLAGNGLTVAATDMDTEGLAEVQARAEELDLPGTVETIEANLADDAEVEAIVDEAATHGDIRYLANIAGLQTIAKIAEFPTEKYDLMNDVMLRAPFLLTKHCWPHFEANGDDGAGAVGNMCSVHGHIATQDKVAYNTVKFGLRGQTGTIAAEGDGRIRGFTVSTAYVKTPLVARQLPDTADSRGITVDEAYQQVMLSKTRNNEMMEPYDVGNLFAYGFSDYARFLNGGDMRHDGGMSHTYM